MTDERNDRSSLEALADLALAVATPPPPELKARLMVLIAAEVSRAPGVIEVARGITAILAADEGFTLTGLPGIEAKVLNRDEARGFTTRFLRFAPGARYPAHRHGGTEEVFVLTGSLVLNGLTLKPGDYCRAEAGTDEPVAFSETGGTAIIISSDRDEFASFDSPR